jgi:hypothetical protein
MCREKGEQGINAIHRCAQCRRHYNQQRAGGTEVARKKATARKQGGKRPHSATATTTASDMDMDWMHGWTKPWAEEGMDSGHT